MTNLIKLLPMTLLSLILGGCGKLASDHYLCLLQHPDVLQEKMAECHDKDTAECEMVRTAAQEYNSLNAQRLSDPELFGKMILQEEQQLGTLKEKLQIAQKDASDHANPQAQATLATLQEAYHAQEVKVNKLLAIVAATSPE